MEERKQKRKRHPVAGAHPTVNLHVQQLFVDALGDLPLKQNPLKPSEYGCCFGRMNGACRQLIAVGTTTTSGITTVPLSSIHWSSMRFLYGEVANPEATVLVPYPSNLNEGSTSNPLSMFTIERVNSKSNVIVTATGLTNRVTETVYRVLDPGDLVPFIQLATQVRITEQSARMEHKRGSHRDTGTLLDGILSWKATILLHPLGERAPPFVTPAVTGASVTSIIPG
jgi:hypothetical protein